jgi:serine phosphatase RsbU (regulator of sigma subunit)
MWPNEILVLVIAIVLYWIGGNLMNRMLTSELVRLTQLEADQVAARQIQQTLTSAKVDEVPGYEVETFYQPLRDVGGDYFDVIELGDKRTLFAIADVSGKGMPASARTSDLCRGASCALPERSTRCDDGKARHSTRAYKNISSRCA